LVDITGKKDALFLKGRYQDRLDHQYSALVEKRDWLYMMEHKLKNARKEMQRLGADIEADEEERKKLYFSLNDLLDKEMKHEGGMFEKYVPAIENNSFSQHQRFKDSDIEEAIFGNVMSFLDKYPEYRTKDSFRNLINQIERVESGIKTTKKQMNSAVADALTEISYFPSNILDFRLILSEYKNILAEANQRIGNCRYVKSFLFNLASEEDKQNVLMDTLYYNPEQFEKTVDVLESEVKQGEIEIQNLRRKFDLKE
jgi:hypothetical protein